MADDAQPKPADKKDAPKCTCGNGDKCQCNAGKCQCDHKAKEPEKKTVMLTGSNLPQQVTKVGSITDSAQPVKVISHDDLEKTGEMNLANALRKNVPAIH
jgi:hypothetical protein